MVNIKQFPILKTGRLILRQITADDKEAIFCNFSDEAVTRWFFDQPFSELQQAEALIDEFDQHFVDECGITWAITLKDENDVIGTCGLEPYQKGGRGEIGFDLVQAYWGKGIMSEALRAAIAYGFECLSLQGIDADTYCDNKRSLILLERLGFSKREQVADYFRFSLELMDWKTVK
ncbi:MAG: GNAT family N-acetyltransferase [Anaerolineales bacterium]|nr:GNAT family N-acetyltransferase [Anaerolineales bacterium]